MKYRIKYPIANPKLKRIISKFLCLVFFMISVQSQAKDTNGATEILDKVLANHYSIPPYAFRLENRVPLRNNDKGIDAELHVREVRWDGDRYDAVMTRYDVVDDHANLTYSKRAIWTGKQYQSRQKGANESSIAAVVSSKEQHMSRVWNSPFSGAFLSGVLPAHTDHVAMILKDIPSVSVRDDFEEVAGHLCYVIQGTIKNNKYTIWVDPNSGFNIRKAIAIIQGEKDSVPQTFELDKVKVEKIGDFYFPLSGTLVAFSRSKENGQMWEAKRSNVEFNPDFEGMNAFKMDLPDGARVVHLDYPGIPYRWSNGRVVTHVDDSYLEVLNDRIMQVKSTVKTESAKITDKTIEPPHEKSIIPTKTSEVAVAPQSSKQSGFGTYLIIALFLLILLAIAIYRIFFGKSQRTKSC
ncbi:MAG: PepSY domain-containing protein [Planctomycetota bacterium]|jgi:hypothetical protein